MTNEEITSASEGEKPWPLIIMLGMLAIVIGAGFILVPKTEEGKLLWLEFLGTNNHGEFMNPPLELVGELLDAQGDPWSADLDIPWKLVLLNQGPCLEDCQEMADVITRVHSRLNKLAPELKRGFLSLGPNAVTRDSALEAFGFEFIQVQNADLQNRLAASGVPNLSEGPLAFVMDPREVFFLYYTQEHDGNGVLEDVEHVIKLSQ